MKEYTTGKAKESRISYDELEEVLRMKIQGFIQEILEEEVTAFLGRGKSERRKMRIDTVQSYRNGYGKCRRFAMMNGTVRVKRPRLRNQEGFESKILPLFKRRSKELGEMLPELYLHGLASGDFELALRGLLGEGAPLSKASICRLKAKWQIEYEEWKKQGFNRG